MEIDDCGFNPRDDYNPSAHVAAIFIILAVGAAGFFVPWLLHVHPEVKPNSNLATFSNFLGTGIVISTAFIHMLYPAIKNLTNPCLGEIAETYPALALLITLFSLLVMHFIEFCVARKIGEMTDAEIDDQCDMYNRQTETTEVSNGKMKREQSTGSFKFQHAHEFENGDDFPSRTFITVIIFEIGVAVHSVIIGLALGVMSGSGFTTLLVALAFHQLFEGYALGSATTMMKLSKMATSITALCYSFSAPIGIFIGILVHSTFNENSKDNLLMIGVFEAISAGTLMYTGIVELLTYGLTINPQFSSENSDSLTCISAFSGLYCGAAMMSFIGLWI